ncbi:hypothetical protein HHI36_005956 [Cryptolaemus montrouzieri]|uniref:Uncharacterized protein n=1 Tax=Cryptolaemus montrouzieri TaxID=559131 RepID=A0ABD2NW70_9CUCU
MASQNVQVDIEYCTECGLFNEFEKAVFLLKEKCPNVEIKGHEGRRGSFEIKMNDTLVHSRLSTLATPDYEDLCRICRNTSEGKPILSKCKTQNDCQIS